MADLTRDQIAELQAARKELSHASFAGLLLRHAPALLAAAEAGLWRHDPVAQAQGRAALGENCEELERLARQQAEKLARAQGLRQAAEIVHATPVGACVGAVERVRSAILAAAESLEAEARHARS